MNFAQLKFFLTGLTFLLMLNACSDDNTSTEAPPATIEITELTPETDKVSFRLIPTNAVSMAYKIEIEGEEGFRRREAHVVDDCARMSSTIVATGGGVVLRPENRENLAKSGFVVYLNVPPHILWERTRADKNRPLLKVDDPLSKLQQLFAQRDPLYREVADLVIDGSRINAQGVTQLLMKEFGNQWSH